MTTPKVLVVLETMWGEPGEAQRWFRINTLNFSGRRLYDLTGAKRGELFVTNACRECVSSANQHGKPDPQWLAENLNDLKDEARNLLLLVCGKVARATYESCGYKHAGPVHFMPHPAARGYWTAATIGVHRCVIQSQIQRTPASK